MSWGQVALMVASAVMQQQAQAKAQRQQDRLINQKSAYQQQKAAEQDAATRKYIAPLSPDARTAEGDAAKADLLANYEKTAAEVSKYLAPDQTAGKVNPDFDRRAASNKATSAERIKALFGDLAAMNAPNQRNLADSYRYTDAAGDVGAAGRAMSTVGSAYDAAAANVRPDPLLSFLGQVAGGASTAAGGVGGSVFPGTTATPVTKGITLGYGTPPGLKPGGGLGLKLT